MKRTQVQLPDPLYRQVKQLAEDQDWSITEVLRRGAEYMVRCYHLEDAHNDEWSLPKPRRMGEFVSSVEQWRDFANDPVSDL